MRLFALQRAAQRLPAHVQDLAIEIGRDAPGRLPKRMDAIDIALQKAVHERLYDRLY